MRRYCGRLSFPNSIILWAPRRAAALINCCMVGADRLTVEIRRMGKSCRKPALQLMELIRIKEVGGGGADLDLHLGYIDHHERASAVMVLASEGVAFGMCASPKGEEGRWSSKGLAETCELFVDSSAAKAVSGRVGLGKTRHI